MLETNRENGKVSSQGSLWRKPYPPGSPTCLLVSFFLGKAAGFILPLLREGKLPRESGDLCDSLRMNFSGCSEKLMPLSLMKGGDGGK